ncbi:MAG: M14 family zinc carboxypeptidase [Bacteroidales bacterium]|nr:M14 family zinc carboxypeptidase [Bacteroidales bacterium]
MKKPFVFLLFSVILLFHSAQAQHDAAADYFTDRSEVYLSVVRPGADDLEALFQVVSVDKMSADSLYVYVNAAGYSRFRDFDLPYTVLRPPGEVDFPLNMLDRASLLSRDLTDSWDFYPTYEAYVALMYQFEEDYPDLVEIINIGATVMGRDLLFARISPDLDAPGGVPRFMYTSTMHGDETAGFVLSLRLIHYLLSNYGVDASITELMHSVEIYICPNENPDGTYTNNNSTVWGATRGNANGVDLNRNYPNPVSNPWQAQQPETTAMINFTDTINFIMSANMHGGIELVNYPFDSWKSWQQTHADHDWWEFVMYEYVDTVHAYSPSGYMTGMGDGVTHGGDWYVVYGSRQDYFNYYRSCREFTLELSNQKILNPSQLPAHWEYNYRSLLNYIRQSTYGVHGFVYDNATGLPLEALVSIPGYDQHNSEVHTTMPYGYYNRPLLSGSYDLSFSSSGFGPVSISGVSVENYQTTRLNVALGEGVGTQAVEVSIEVEGLGAVDPFVGVEWFNQGANVFLQAQPEEDWMFVHWLINGEYFEKEELVHTLEGNTEIIAFFEKVPEEPSIALDQYHLDFGMRLTGKVHSRELVIRNLGNAMLSVHLELEGDEAFSLEEPAAKHTYHIGPGSEQAVPVYFLPYDEDEYVAQLVINSNDPYMYVIIIAVTGSAVHEGALIHLSESFLDFAKVNISETAQKEVTVYNEGNLSFTLEEIDLDSDVFFIDGEFPVGIDPGDHYVLTLSFQPQTAGVFEQQAILVSDALNETATGLMLLGEGVDPTHVAMDPDAGAGMAVYPNPVVEHSALKIRLSQAEDVDVAVFSMQGKLLGRIYTGMLPPGEHRFSLESVYRNMETGVYVVVVRAGAALMTERVIRVRP